MWQYYQVVAQADYLESEGSETNDHGSGEEEGLDDYTLVEEGDQDTHCVGLNHGEGSEENEVDGGLFPLDLESNQKPNREEECWK